jgi:hypothetical protein
MRRLFRAVPSLTFSALIASALASAACTALLGDFDVAAASLGADGGGVGADGGDDVRGPSPDGGSNTPDAPNVPDGGSNTPGGDGGPPSAPTLTCTRLRFARPIVLANLQGGNVSVFDEGLVVERVRTNELYVAAPIAKSGGTIVAYFDPTLPNPVPSAGIGATAFQRLYGSVRFSDGIGLVGAVQVPGSNGFDASLATVRRGRSEGERMITQGANLPGDALVAPLAISDRDIFLSAIVRPPSRDAELLVAQTVDGVGGRAHRAATVASASGDLPVMFWNGIGHVYVNGGPAPPRPREFVLRGDVPPTSLLAGRALSAGAVPSFLIAAKPSEDGKRVRFAAGEDRSQSGGGFVYRIADVPSDAVGDVTVETMRNVGTVNDIHRLPFNKGAARWSGADLFMAGKPPSDRGGINFIWFDAGGNRRGETTGAGTNLMPENGLIRLVGIDIGERIGTTYTTFDLAWIERRLTTDNQEFDVLLYNTLVCEQ